MPWIGPRWIPNREALASGLPAAVLVVWVPWPLESRAVVLYSSSLKIEL